MAASREFINSVDPEEMTDTIGNVRISTDHFEHALEEVTASVTPETREQYEEIEAEFDTAEPQQQDQLGRTFQ